MNQFYQLVFGFYYFIVWINNVKAELYTKYYLYKLSTKDDVEKYLSDKGFTVDWIGRISIVVQIPNEFLESDDTIQSYIYAKMQEHKAYLLNCQLADNVWPSVETLTQDTVFIIYTGMNFESDPKTFIWNLLYYTVYFSIIGFLVVRFNLHIMAIDFLTWLLFN